jgi:hypothetical protein
MVKDSNFTVCIHLLHIKQIKTVITVYVHLFFTLPRFSSLKLWENKLDKKIFPKNGKRMKTVQNLVNLAV